MKKKTMRVRYISPGAAGVRDVSKKVKRISLEELAKALGAVLITDPKEIARLRKKFPPRLF
ncbi:MAG: hypothetical protein AAB389_01560 [Patescibacteria group bacterium]